MEAFFPLAQVNHYGGWLAVQVSAEISQDAEDNSSVQLTEAKEFYKSPTFIGSVSIIGGLVAIIAICCNLPTFCSLFASIIFIME